MNMTLPSHVSPVRIWPETASAVTAPWPLHDTATGHRIEQSALDACPPHALMQKAGLAVARLALAIAPHAPALWIAAGPGNNGGDGLEAACHLQRWGRSVRVSLLGDAARLPNDAAAALIRAQEVGVALSDSLPTEAGRSCDLIIDALLGSGSNRPPAGAMAEAIAAMQRSTAPVLAVDLPTGLDADTGRVLDPSGQYCVQARHTLALLTLKPGLFTAQGRDHAGTVWLDDLGTPSQPEEATALLASPGWIDALLPRRRHADHKGRFGDVLVMGGDRGMSGAPLLCARAALTSGAGRVYLHLLHAEAAWQTDAQMPELMMREGDSWKAPLEGRSLTVACGCGGGHAVAEVLPDVLEHAARVVLDADALNALSADASLRKALQARARNGQPSILTPHPLEAARLLNSDTATVQAHRLRAARQIAEQFGCTVVLKGSGSVIASPGQRPTLNPSGNAALATAGTGDVLAGWIAGLWSQGLDADAAALAGTYTHGAAADQWVRHPGARVLTASRLLEQLAAPRS